MGALPCALIGHHGKDTAHRWLSLHTHTQLVNWVVNDTPSTSIYDVISKKRVWWQNPVVPQAAQALKGLQPPILEQTGGFVTGTETNKLRLQNKRWRHTIQEQQVPLTLWTTHTSHASLPTKHKRPLEYRNEMCLADVVVAEPSRTSSGTSTQGAPAPNPQANQRFCHGGRNQQTEAAEQKVAPHSTGATSASDALDDPHRTCLPPYQAQAPTQVPQQNVPGWHCDVAPGGRDVGEVVPTGMLDKNRTTMVKEGDVGSSCSRASPILPIS